MLTEKNLRDLKMDNIQEYFIWITDTAVSGEMPMPHELLYKLNKKQTAEFVSWLESGEERVPPQAVSYCLAIVNNILKY